MSSGIDLKYLQLVVAVAEEGTLTRAGKRLHLTQSALSHQLAALEGRFGVEIFRRQGRHLRLTPLGEHLVLRARMLVTEVEALESDLMWPQVRKQELRVVTQCFTCYHWLPTLLPAFGLAHPDVTVTLVVESTRHALEALDANAVDLAITTERRSDARYRTEFVFDDELMVALGPGHRLGNHPRLSYADLRTERLLLHPPSEADKRWFGQMVACDGPRSGPRETQHIPVTDAIIELVASGYGCALLTRLSAERAAAQGRILLRSFEPQRLTRDFYAFSRRDNPKRLAVDGFVQAVANYCRPKDAATE
jgi:LysR family transcriptional regulator, regulator for metE and metH